MARRSRKSGFDIFIKLIISMLKAIEKDSKRKSKEQQKALKEAQKKAEKTPQALFKKYRSEILSKSPLKKQQAVSIYRRLLKEEGSCEYQIEIDEAIEGFKESIQHEIDCLSDDYDNHKYNIQAYKEEIKDLKYELKNCDQEDRENSLEQIEDLKDEIEEEILLMNKSKEPIEKFKTDMSEFLIENIRVDLYGCE